MSSSQFHLSQYFFLLLYFIKRTGFPSFFWTFPLLWLCWSPWVLWYNLAGYNSPPHVQVGYLISCKWEVSARTWNGWLGKTIPFKKLQVSQNSMIADIKAKFQVLKYFKSFNYLGDKTVLKNLTKKCLQREFFLS